MSDGGDSDDYPGFNLSQFTAEDFAKIDADVARQYDREGATNTATAPAASASTMHASYMNKGASKDAVFEEVESDTDSNADTISIESDEVLHRPSDVSFRSDDFDINLGQLTAEQLALLDGPAATTSISALMGPSNADVPAIEIELEGADVVGGLPTEQKAGTGAGAEMRQNNRYYNYKRWHDKSPLERFRSYISLSVTDLVGPSWCEVQYDYGLRGKRSRPLKDRPKSFVSASGKTIVPTVAVAQKNENTTNQGLKVHKELERETKFAELKVDITTPETRWALRIVNMMACLRGIVDGFTREMPVFGILHDEIVVGIMDEVVKVELSRSDPDHSPDCKRSSEEPHAAHTGAKKPRLAGPDAPRTPSRQRAIDSYFDSPTRKKSAAGGRPAVANTSGISELSKSPGAGNTSPRPSWQVSVDRFFDNATKGSPSKPASSANTGPPRPKWQIPVDQFFEKVASGASTPAVETPDNAAPSQASTTPMRPPPGRPQYILQIKDNKTRRSRYMPSEADTYSGRMQLMIYRRLLSELLCLDPPYDFTRLWKKLHLDATQVFPTRFLVQAQLIRTSNGHIVVDDSDEESEAGEFNATCLGDLVESWRRLVRESGVVGVSDDLELVYRLRPSESDGKEEEGSAKAEAKATEASVEDQENLDLAKAIEESLEASGNASATVPVQQHSLSITTSKSPSEEEQLQWALQQSMLPEFGGSATVEAEPMPADSSESVPGVNEASTPAPPQRIAAEEAQTPMPAAEEEVQLETSAAEVATSEDEAPPETNANADVDAKDKHEDEGEGKGKGKVTGKAPERTKDSEETGIRRYEVIGTHKFKHDDAQLDRHLTHVLQWWHGERKPEGVSLEHAYRCSTCEYINDCEWRAEKAMEHLTRKKSEASLRNEGR